MPDDLLVPLTLVVGDEGLLVDRAVSRVVRAFRAADPEADVTDLPVAELEPGDVAGLLAPSLFGDARLLVLRGVQDAAKDLAAELAATVEDLPDDVLLVLVHAGGAKGKALLATLSAVKGVRTVLAAKVTRPGERRDLVRRELKEGGRQVSEEAVTLLLDAVGTDLRELCAAASQLLSDTEGAITEQVVSTYYKGRAETSGFAVADRAVEGDLAGALELVRWGESAGLAHVLVTSALASTLRSVARVASAGRVPAGQLASQLGMPPWKVEKTQRQARAWRPEGLTVALQAVAVADGDVKGSGAADPAYAVERALLAVVQARELGA
ncbi:MAG: polymerase delta subunit [Frankiales bacterium]|nr:polymerase delta subunit [Frankiales bacterium]